MDRVRPLAFQTLYALSLVLGLSACSLIERSPRSGYYSESEEGEAIPSIYEQKQLSLTDDAKEELGLQGHVLTDEERDSLENRIRLKRMEGRLGSKREKRQYYGLRSTLKNDSERIYFLSLPTVEARERWAAGHGISSGQPEIRSEETAKLIEANDITLGMSSKAVQESWGDPDTIEVAGNPLYGNERWKYNRYVSGNEGYQKELRIVYFEGGKVVGWERPN